MFSRALLEIHIISKNEEARYALFYGTEVRALKPYIEDLGSGKLDKE